MPPTHTPTSLLLLSVLTGMGLRQLSPSSGSCSVPDPWAAKPAVSSVSSASRHQAGASSSGLSSGFNYIVGCSCSSAQAFTAAELRDLRAQAALTVDAGKVE